MKKSLKSISLAAIVLLTACSRSEPADNGHDSSGENTAYLYEGALKISDSELIKQTFIPELDSLIEDGINMERSRIGTNSVRIDDPELGKGLYHYYALNDGRSLFYDAGSVIFENNLPGNAAPINYSVFSVYPSEELVRELYPLREIDGLSSQEALDMAQDIIEKLNIPNLGGPQIYTCLGEDNYWDGDDFYITKDVYYIFCPVTLDGSALPYDFTYFPGAGWVGYYGFAEFVFSADGLESFDMEYINDYTKTESCEIISQEEAAAIVANTIGRAVETGSVGFSEGKLTYISNMDKNTGESALYPAWCFIKSHEVTSGDDSIQPNMFYEQIFIDAQTGKILS